MFQSSSPTQEEASLKVHRSRSVRRVEVTTDGRNLVSHAGTALLCELADRTGLTHGLSEAMADCGISWNTHDPGVVLTHLAVAIADGADCLKDIDALRKQSELFGEVASISTAWRAVKATTAPSCARSERPWQSHGRSSGPQRRRATSRSTSTPRLSLRSPTSRTPHRPTSTVMAFTHSAPGATRP